MPDCEAVSLGKATTTSGKNTITLGRLLQQLETFRNTTSNSVNNGKDCISHWKNYGNLSHWKDYIRHWKGYLSHWKDDLSHRKGHPTPWRDSVSPGPGKAAAGPARRMLDEGVTVGVLSCQDMRVRWRVGVRSSDLHRPATVQPHGFGVRPLMCEQLTKKWGAKRAKVSHSPASQRRAL